jgi:hypothetical protein
MRIENWLYTLPLRLRSLVSGNRWDADVDEELRDHIDRLIDENLARGMGKGKGSPRRAPDVWKPCRAPRADT